MIDMGLFVGSTPVNAVYVGSTPVKAVYVGAEKIWPTTDVHEVSLTNMRAESLANKRNYDLVTIEVPAGATWTVRVQGSFTRTGNDYPSGVRRPTIVIGNSESGRWREGEPVDFTGAITSANSGIQVRAYQPSNAVNFVGTVTIEK